jgi:protease-4
MTLELDLLLDRRRLKRRLVFWRCLTVASLLVAAFVLIRQSGLTFNSAHLARLSVTGTITEDRKLQQLLSRVADNPDTKALIVAINSPGGSVTGGESLHRALSQVAAKKPVVVVMGGLAASAGYMIALPAHQIFARESTLTGSIGVLLETGEISSLLAKLGITSEAITSGELKDQPNTTRPLTERGREVLRGIVMDMYEQFVGMVVAGRNLEPTRVRELADGRAYTGRQALSLGLIDAIGGEQEARGWLAAQKNVDTDLPVKDLSTAGLASRTLGSVLFDAFDALWKILISQSVSLDGGMAVWQRRDG